jgi:heme/copper-type cytochrome/quinol oxidase subunit 2
MVWLLLGLVGFAVAFVPFPNFINQPTERVFRVQASQFAYSPGEINVNPGDRVTIELVSTDVVHGLYIDGYGLSMEADPGQSSQLEFTADRSGSYRLRCNVSCGAMHPFMIGKLVVGQNQLLWRGIGLAGLALLSVLVGFVYRQPSQ